MDSTLHHLRLQAAPFTPKGGLRTLPFVIVNEALEKVATYGLLANMITYLTCGYNMDAATGGKVLYIWSAFMNFTPLLGAFVSDTYLGRFGMIAVGSIISFLGTFLLWLTAIEPSAKPYHEGEQASLPQICLLFSALAILSLGTGGIRPCSIAFGADQLDRGNTPENARTLQAFFNWYYASIESAILVAMTALVYIQDRFQFIIGLGVPTLLMALSAVFFLVGSPMYVKVPPNRSMFTGFFQTGISAFRNKHLAFPPRNSKRLHYHHQRGSNLIDPTEKLRFLNKACIVRSTDKYLRPEELCTVEQVEELKALIKVLPIWSTGIMIAATINQHSFPVLQAKTMDRKVTSSFRIPAASYGAFSILSLILSLAIYDRLLVPLLAKLTGNPRGISLKQRMGIGLFISIITMVVSAITEKRRRDTAIDQGLLNNGTARVNMSALWLVPQHCLTGLSEAFSTIGQIDFFHSQFPKSMSSIGVALVALGWGLGNLLGSFIVEIVDDISTRGGGDSWVANNLNRGRYDYYYWLLAGLSLVNFFYFLVCSCSYGRCYDKNSTVCDPNEPTISGMESG